MPQREGGEFEGAAERDEGQQFDGEPIVAMPAKTETTIYVEFTGQQWAYYNKLFSTAKEKYAYFKTIQGVGRGTIQILANAR